MQSRALWLSACLLLLLTLPLQAFAKNGFNLTNSTIPLNKILQGGPPRDGIPSLDKPKFMAAAAASYLKPDDRILGVFHKGVARAYPIRILNWHEIVNDRIQGDSVVVTFCPLCGTGLVYDGNIDGKFHDFGVSGLLYNSDVLLYDRQTETLWSQILSKAVSGPMVGRALKTLPVAHTSWQSWRKKHPNTQVLSTDTGFGRDYSRSPYGDYDENGAIYFPVSKESRAYHPKERVLGIELNGQFRAYPFEELAKLNGNVLQDNFAGQQLTIRFDVANRDGTITDQSGRIVHAVNGFWFAWYAFHNDTTVFKAN